MAKKKIVHKKGKRSGSKKVLSKRKLETTKHSLGIIYYVIMIIFAISLFITLSIIWVKLGTIFDSLETIDNTNSTSPGSGMILFYIIKNLKIILKLGVV